jgi:hypothetical protein
MSKEKLAAVVANARKHLDVAIANSRDPDKDKHGSCSNLLAGQLRCIGVADFVLVGDVASFRKHLSGAAEIQAKLFGRHAAGEAVDASYVSMLAYQRLFDALAAGNNALASSLASLMGGRDDIEKKHDHRFDYAMGYTLRAFVLRHSEEMTSWASNFSEISDRESRGDFRGYAQVFKSILDSDPVAAGDGMRKIVEGHKRQCKGAGVFAFTDDEYLCVWGIGMSNLARSYGLTIEPIPPLIPGELLI